ncbi:MAG: Ig-like domain-containing protein, partial [Gemmatimonadaceae bacterium]|nr:Ig-like domain-containing protein [Gemmatimonadaceae bacterium]
MLAAAGLVIAAAACGGDGPTPPGGARSLSLVPDTDIKLYGVGATAQVTATPRDASGNAVSAPVTWTSSNQGVATVASTGETTATVTARGIGTATIRAAVSSTVFAEVTVTVQQPQFNVNAGAGFANACEIPDMRSFRIETETDHLIIATDLANPSGGFTAQDYAAIAATFESLVWPVDTENFGAPADRDGNGKVIAFYTRAVNELTPAGSNFVIGGFFFGRDLFPKVAAGGLDSCPTSNEAEMFYMLVPDPNGEVNGNVRSVAGVRNLTVGTLAHEFQH